MQRIGSLDAVRGLAALAVLNAHLRGVFTRHYQLIDLSPAYLLWAGQEAVVLFFVLSGYVLVHRALHGPRQNYRDFLVARVLRIGVPYWVMLGICAVSIAVLGGPGQEDLPHHWPQSFDDATLWRHVPMVLDVNTGSFNLVFWSLIHEMRFALVFPVFLLLVRSCSVKQAVGTMLAVTLAVSTWLAWQGDASIGFRSSWLQFSRYLCLFGLGGLAAVHAPRWLAWMQTLPEARVRWGGVVALVLVTYARAGYEVPKFFHLPALAQFGQIWDDLVLGGAATWLLLQAQLDGPWQRVLSHPWARWLGQVSFSLYLVHMPVLQTVFTLMAGVSVWVTFPVAVAAVALFTWVFHLSVEQPVQRWARRLNRGRAVPVLAPAAAAAEPSVEPSALKPRRRA